MAQKNSTTKSQLVMASARQLHVSPRKMRLVTNLVKGMYITDALMQLQHANKKAAPMVIKLINSAVANAQHNFSLNPDFLYIKTITADQGQVMKRYFPRARGSANVIRRKLCSVNIVIEEKKRGKISNKFSLFKKAAKSEEKVQSVDAKESTAIKPAEILGKKSQVSKTEEQVKKNLAQNKRRLFNRKSGV